VPVVVYRPGVGVRHIPDVKFRNTLYITKSNPWRDASLQHNDWEPSLLIGLKFLGSVVVLGALTASNFRTAASAYWLTAGLASFSLWLLGYLVWA